MKFRLGVVGHQDTLQMVSELVKEYFDEVEIYAEDFSNDDILADVVQRVARLQTVCNGILYSRLEPYLLISGQLHHSVPVSYVEIDKSDLLISLLKAVFSYGIGPTNISVDTFDRTTTVEAFRMVGVSEERLTIHTVMAEAGQDGLVNSTLTQHLENHRNGALLCITNISGVYRSLLKLNVPATLISPTTESFVHEIRNLILRYQLKIQDSSRLAVMHIRLQYRDQYRFFGEMPIREIDELSNAAKLMAVFAERVDGAMYSLSHWEHLIVCSRLLLQNATEQFVDIDLMKSINQNTVFDAAIGIGCGQTVKEAQSNAVLASRRTLTNRGTNVVVALSPEHLIGPISPKSKHFTVESTVEARLAGIAATTGLSNKVLNQLYQATRMRNSNLFTSAELAETLEVTARTANRLVERLLDHQYAVIAGKNLATPKGRPARVIRLLL